MNRQALSLGQKSIRGIIFIFCVLLALLSVMPFWIMMVNATRTTPQIQQATVSLIPSWHVLDNLKVISGKAFNPMVGFVNSLIISCGVTVCAVYFSSLTAYSLVVYNWRFRQPFFTFIMVVMMIPAQITTIGFYQFVYKLGLINNFLPLIIPAIASPSMVFFMRQYLIATLSVDIVNSARIDSAGEFRIFNQIVLPIMRPALATQAIFAFVGSWNNLFLPMVILISQEKFTMPIMVSLLRGDIYKTEYGAIYLGLTFTTLPLFVVYFSLSKYIIAGVALGGVKE